VRNGRARDLYRAASALAVAGGGGGADRASSASESLVNGSTARKAMSSLRLPHKYLTFSPTSLAISERAGYREEKSFILAIGAPCSWLKSALPPSPAARHASFFPFSAGSLGQGGERRCLPPRRDIPRGRRRGRRRSPRTTLSGTAMSYSSTRNKTFVAEARNWAGPRETRRQARQGHRGAFSRGS